MLYKLVCYKIIRLNFDVEHTNYNPILLILYNSTKIIYIYGTLYKEIIDFNFQFAYFSFY